MHRNCTLTTCTVLVSVLAGMVWVDDVTAREPAGGIPPAHGEPAAPKEYPQAGLLMGTDRLAEALAGELKDSADQKFVVIDARDSNSYGAGHIPGAFNIESDPLQAPKRKPYFLPDPAHIEKLANVCGIDPDSRIVVYDAQAGRLAARVWFIFWANGHDRVSILDGGFHKWRIEKRSVSQKGGFKAKQVGTWKAEKRPRGICTFELLNGYLPPAPPPGKVPMSTVIDARAFEEYKGEDVRAKIGGHVPGAVNIPWDTMLVPVVAKGPKAKKDGYFVWRSSPEIHAILRAAAITPTQPIVVYGQSGGRSSHLHFTLLLMGYKQTVNYVGGWREYGNRDDVSVER